MISIFLVLFAFVNLLRQACFHNDETEMHVLFYFQTTDFYINEQSFMETLVPENFVHIKCLY